LAYLSPDPPTENSFVKIFHKGKYEQPPEALAPGKWATTSEIAPSHGKMNVRIPAGLKAGKCVCF
jgi:cellulase